jgi:caa(3)-type oxidase subunit IV
VNEHTQNQLGYNTVFALLVGAFAASVVIAQAMAGSVAVFLIFSIAVVKAWLVLNYFVHLRAEPRWVKVLVLGVLTLLAILYVGLVPDIVWVYGGGS